MIHDGLWCAFENHAMGSAADYTARMFDVSRADQDTWSVESHRRAVAARESGKFTAEIVPIGVGGGKTAAIVSADEGPRADSSPEKLAALKPAFDPAGTVTAGNASQISDGAAALVVVDDAVRKSLAVPWAFRVVAAATSGVAPKDIFIAPVEAVRKCLAKTKLQVGDVDLFEINEAFASQTLACARELKVDPARLNVHGGAIALGHPIGASGARVLVTLLHALIEHGKSTGVATLCLGGGNAVAMLVERV
jgi:acetyl-CoA C-acetyltransferase